MTEPKKNLALSASLFGEKIAKSYLHVHKGLIMLAIAIKKAALPKSQGEYNLDIATIAPNEII